LYLTVQRQASVLAYIDTLWVFAGVCAVMAPFAFLMKRPKPGKAAMGH
jgi:hypothetical protein